MTRISDTHNEATHFQTGRFIQQNSEWYYATRENVERGPFIRKEDAIEDLNVYIYHRHNLEEYGH